MSPILTALLRSAGGAAAVGAAFGEAADGDDSGRQQNV